MTHAQTAPGSRQDNFLVTGFRELGRTYTRFRLRQKIRRQGTERKSALAALGQRAWEEKVDLTAFADLRDRLTGLDVRAGELSQTTSKLESDKAALELERRTELETFSTRRREIEEQKTPVDTALRAARARKTEREQTVAQSDARIAALAGQLPPLDSEIAALSALVAPDQPQRLAAAKEKRVRLAAEQADLGPKLAAARTELPGLGAEEHRLAGESQQRAAEIAAVDAEQKAALARIDASLGKVRSESQGTSQQSNAVRTQRAETFGSLGQGLYDAGVRPPALAEPVERVAAIDRVTAETESALGTSMTETRSLPHGTMLKFWGLVAGVPLLLGLATVGTSQYMARRAEAEAAAAAAARPVSSEAERNLTVQRFIQGGGSDDRSLRPSAVRILKEDLLTMGSTAERAYMPLLMRILRSDEPDLRAAAADAMGMIRPAQSETAELTRLLKDPVPRVAEAARRALAESSDPEARSLGRSVQSTGK